MLGEQRLKLVAVLATKPNQAFVIVRPVCRQIGHVLVGLWQDVDVGFPRGTLSEQSFTCEHCDHRHSHLFFFPANFWTSFKKKWFPTSNNGLARGRRSEMGCQRPLYSCVCVCVCVRRERSMCCVLCVYAVSVVGVCVSVYVYLRRGCALCIGASKNFYAPNQEQSFGCVQEDPRTCNMGAVMVFALGAEKFFAVVVCQGARVPGCRVQMTSIPLTDPLPGSFDIFPR